MDALRDPPDGDDAVPLPAPQDIGCHAGRDTMRDAAGKAGASEVLDRLAADPLPDGQKRVRLLYVSPLKALSHDVDRNLRAPLAGITAATGQTSLLGDDRSRDGSLRDEKARDRDADVEMIAPSLPASGTPSVVEVAESDADAASVAPLGAAGAVQQRRVWINFITLCGAIFMNGWNDGTTGPLLPRIQEFYHVSAPSDG